MSHRLPNRVLILTACAVVMLSTIGASLPYPILAPLFADGKVSALNHYANLPPKFLFCLALAINPLGLFAGSAVLGAMSDRYGRRMLLLGTLLVSALGHLCAVWALAIENYPLFLLARLITGLAEGNGSIARAMLADEIDGEARTRAFAWFNSCAYAGWLLGPLFAGLTVSFGNGVPFEIAALVLGLTFVAGIFVFPNRAASHSEGGFWHQITDRHSLLLLKDPEIRRMFLIDLAYTLGVTAFYEFYPLWMVEFLHMNATQISIVTALLCGVMTATSALIGRGWIRPGRPIRMAYWAVFTGACVLLTGLGGPLVGLVALVLFGVPNAMFNSILPDYCSDRYATHGHGSVLGLISTVFCISNVIVALVGAGVTLLDSRLILILGGLATIGAGAMIPRWLRAATASDKSALISLHQSA